MKVIMDDKYTLEDFGMKAVDGHELPLTPNYTNRHKKIPGRSKLWDFGTELEGMSFQLPIGMKRMNKIDKTKKLNEFIAFVTDMYKKPRYVKFRFDVEPDKFIIAKLTTDVSVVRKLVGQDLSLSFTSIESDKFALSNEYDPKRIIKYGEVQPGDFYKNTQSFEWIYRKHYSGIHNYSPYVTKINVTLKGRVKNASITHLQSKTKLTLPDMSNGTMIVNSENYLISVNGNSSLGSNLDFFDILPGDNGFLFEGETPNAKITFDWLHRF